MDQKLTPGFGFLVMFRTLHGSTEIAVNLLLMQKMIFAIWAAEFYRYRKLLN